MGIISQLLSETDIHPVLVDIGASYESPQIWNSIASHSIYVGFDPDRRDISELDDGFFHKTFLINKAITSDESSEVLFNLTKHPQRSSVLKPDSNSLSNFLYSDLFVIEKEEKVDATSLDSVLKFLDFNKINWLKTDTQGTDLRIFNSLSNEIRSQVLAVDIEPGLIDAYIGEDLFIEVHRNLVSQGFWLSNLNVCGSIRLKKLSLERLTEIAPDLKPEVVNLYHKKTPCWCEARYLRTVDWLAQGNFSKSDYIMLWIFSLLDNQIGFAAEVAFEYERIFGQDKVSQAMLNEAILRLRGLHGGVRMVRTVLKKVASPRIKKWLKGLTA